MHPDLCYDRRIHMMLGSKLLLQVSLRRTSDLLTLVSYTLQKGGFILRIAIIDDLEMDARQLADQIMTYMAKHRIPADTPRFFLVEKNFLPGLCLAFMILFFLIFI